MANELYRRMLMFSPEILEDLMSKGGVREETLGAITHSIGPTAASPNPYVRRRDQTLQEQAQRFNLVKKNMFGQAVPGGSVEKVASRFSGMIEKQRQAANFNAGEVRPNNLGEGGMRKQPNNKSLFEQY